MTSYLRHFELLPHPNLGKYSEDESTRLASTVSTAEDERDIAHVALQRDEAEPVLLVQSVRHSARRKGPTARKCNAPTAKLDSNINIVSDGDHTTGVRDISACGSEPLPVASTVRTNKASKKTIPGSAVGSDDADSAASVSLGGIGGVICGGGVAADETRGGRTVRSKQRTTVTSGVGSGKTATAVKPRLQSRANSSAMGSASSLRVEDDVQGMVDKIKSRNRNHGGGRQAKGGHWTCKRFCVLIFYRKGECACCKTPP